MSGQRMTDYRVMVSMTGTSGMSVPVLVTTFKAAQSWGGIRRRRVIEKIQPDGSWRQLSNGPDPRPEPVK